MPEQDALEILIDSDVHLPCKDTPKQVVDALRRHLRQHGSDRLLRYDQGHRSLLNLLRTMQGYYRLPQAVLPCLTDICRRRGIPHVFVDRRVSAPATRLRCQAELTTAQGHALRALLRRDCGLLVASNEQERMAVAAELIARRQQRTLFVTSPDAKEPRAAQLRRAFGVGSRDVCLHGMEDADSPVVVASYEDTLTSVEGQTYPSYGMVVLDMLSQVDPVALMHMVRGVAPRHSLGLADGAVRPDGLHGALYLALGGITHQLLTAATSQGLRLTIKRRLTPFAFPYEGRDHYQSLLAKLATDAQRNELIVQDIARESQAGHPCLVLSERRDQLEGLRDQLTRRVDASLETITSDVRPAERSAIVARFNRDEVGVLLATGQIAADSLDVHATRRLFIAFPFSYARRLERIVKALLQPSNGKNDATVYDYDDVDVVPLHRAFNQRARVLARLQSAAEREYLRWAQTELSF